MGQITLPPTTQSLYLDTSLYIYYFENHHTHAETVEKILTTALEKNQTLIASTLILTELLVAPLRDNNQQLIDVYNKLPLLLPNFDMRPITVDIATYAARLRAIYHVTTPDALHLATAILSNVTHFFTNDKKLTKISEITVVTL